jgi:hypothetical protein
MPESQGAGEGAVCVLETKSRVGVWWRKLGELIVADTLRSF